MIDQLKISNFQSHEETKLNFDKGVNVIIGSSDSGKTAIFRALRWLVWNKPGGDEFRSYWGGGTEVVLKSKDSFVSRTKSNENLYQLNDTVFKAFGTNVPEEIQSALNLSEINLQQQLDSPFLLSETPGNVAKHFNKIAKLDKIDEANSNIRKLISDIDRTIKVKEEKLQEYETELEALPDLDVIECRLEELEQLEINRNTLSKQKYDLTKLLIEFPRIEDELKECNDLLELEKGVDSIFNKINEKENLEKKQINLSGLLEDIEIINSEESNLQLYLGLQEPVNTLLTKIAERSNLKARATALNNLTNTITVIDTKLLKTQENVVKMEKVFKKEMGNVCVLCGTELK